MTTYEVVFTDDARQDLFDIYTYIAIEDSIAKADKLIESLKNACKRLSELPTRGHVPHEFDHLNISDYLEIHCKEYRIIYEVVGKTVYIYCVVHMKRDVEELLKQRLLRSTN
ncbi:MAG: type II toxin-antitoxin system RelE/ParE family toxin [bacterium]